ncbi:MAG: tetratricopeptide repeat protein, partial [Thermoplasmata archaeon]
MVNVCPVCGSENPDDADVCQSCNIRLKAILKSKSNSTTDAEIDTLVKSILVKREVSDRGKRETKPEPLVSKKRELEIPLPQERLSEKPSEEESTFRCPTCNSKVPANAARCEKCGTLFKDEENAFHCPICNTLLPYATTVCPKCHAEFGEAHVQKPEKQMPPESAKIPEGTQVPAPTPAAKPLSEQTGKGPHPSQLIIDTTLKPAPASLPAQTPAAPAAPRAPTITPEISEEVKISFLKRYFVDILTIVSVCILIGIFAGFRMWELSDMFWIGFVVLLAVGAFLSSLIFVIINRASMEIITGDRLLHQHKYQEAIRHYDSAIKLGLNLTVAWTNKGVAYKKLRRYAEALACFNCAIQLDPKNEVAWTNKGDIYFKMGKFNDAIRCY